MEINPKEYLKPRIVDVDIVSPQRAKSSSWANGKRIWVYFRKFY